MCWVVEGYAFCTPDANSHTTPGASTCCNLTRASSDARDLGFGYEGMHAGMTPEAARVAYLRHLGATIKKWQAVVLLLVGILFVFYPKFCTEHFLASKAFLEENGLTGTSQERVEEMHHRQRVELLKQDQDKNEDNRGFALKALHSWLSDVVGPDAKEQEIRDGEAMLADVINAKAERLASLRPPAVLYNPTRLYGSSYIAFGITSLILDASTPTAVLNVALVSVVPYSCSLAAFFVSAVDNQLASMESSTYMTILFGVYAGAIAFWSWLGFNIKDAINALRLKSQDLEMRKCITERDEDSDA